MFLPCSTTLSVSPLSTESIYSLSMQKIKVLFSSLWKVSMMMSRGLSTPQSQTLSALKQENPHAQQTGLYIFKFFKPFQKAAHWETNGYCSPTTPMAGSGTWLPCGMTPHPWLHPEVTPNMVLFAEATSMCHHVELPLDLFGFVLH